MDRARRQQASIALFLVGCAVLVFGFGKNFYGGVWHWPPAFGAMTVLYLGFGWVLRSWFVVPLAIAPVLMALFNERPSGYADIAPDGDALGLSLVLVVLLIIWLPCACLGWFAGWWWDGHRRRTLREGEGSSDFLRRKAEKEEVAPRELSRFALFLVGCGFLATTMVCILGDGLGVGDSVRFVMLMLAYLVLGLVVGRPIALAIGLLPLILMLAFPLASGADAYTVWSDLSLWAVGLLILVPISMLGLLSRRLGERILRRRRDQIVTG